MPAAHSLPPTRRSNFLPTRTAVLAAAFALLGSGAAMAVPRTAALPHVAPRSIDGSGNNINHPTWGAAKTDLLQSMSMAYDDSISTPAGAHLPSARFISNTVVAQPKVGSEPHVSNFLWMWGQIIDHDLDLTDTQVLAEAPYCDEEFDVEVPSGDTAFDPDGTGTQVIQLCRSVYDHETGGDADHPRDQTNSITSFIDGSMVYGSDPVRAHDLRKNDGSGELRTSVGADGREMVPFNVNNLPNPMPGPDHYLCGDKRCEENTNLLVLQTLLLREHNYWARRVRQESPRPLTDEEIYQRARLIVGAEIQGITYNEFLPILVGPGAIPRYTGYHPDVNPAVDTVFSTAAYRFGHTMLTHTLSRLDSRLRPIPGGELTLKDAFFNGGMVNASGGIEPFLRGAAYQRANAFDPFIVDDVRNFLLNEPAPGTFDLASLNIQRGRDHGLAGYNAVRIAFGLEPKTDFADVNPSPLVSSRLAAAYDNVDDIDPWLGGIAEVPVRHAIVGELVQKVLADQFTRTRDGDRFWYQNIFSDQWVEYFDHLTLNDLIVRNTSIKRQDLPADAFLAK